MDNCFRNALLSCLAVAGWLGTPYRASYKGETVGNLQVDDPAMRVEQLVLAIVATTVPRAASQELRLVTRCAEVVARPDIPKKHGACARSTTPAQYGGKPKAIETDMERLLYVYRWSSLGPR